jgi:hypothetical protein
MEFWNSNGVLLVFKNSVFIFILFFLLGKAVFCDEETSGKIIWEPVNIQIVPGKNILPRREGENVTNRLFVGLFAGSGNNLRGLGFGSIGLTNAGDVRGIEIGGMYTIVKGDVRGIQNAGIFNITNGDMRGLQAGGLFNVVNGNMYGLQTGIVNVAKGKTLGIQHGIFNWAGTGKIIQVGVVNVSENGEAVTLGLLNLVRDGILHAAFYYDDSEFFNMSFRSGSKYFYSIHSAGIRKFCFNRDEDDDAEKPGLKAGDTFVVYRSGFGVELPVKNAFFDLDITRGTILNLDTQLRSGQYAFSRSDQYEDYQMIQTPFNAFFNSAVTGIIEVRLTAGYKFRKHLGVFAGVSYDYLMPKSNVSPTLRSFLGDHVLVRFSDHNKHKIGFFSGVQF